MTTPKGVKPSREGRMGGERRIGSELDQARSFQASWSLVRFLSKETSAAAVATEVTGLFEDLGIRPESPVANYLVAEDDSLMRLVSEAGIQLKRRRPALLPYFEAGWNIMLDIVSNNGAQLTAIASTIDLPDNLANPADAASAMEWANTVAEHFHQRVYSR